MSQAMKDKSPSPEDTGSSRAQQLRDRARALIEQARSKARPGKQTIAVHTNQLSDSLSHLLKWYTSFSFCSLGPG